MDWATISNWVGAHKYVVALGVTAVAGGGFYLLTHKSSASTATASDASTAYSPAQYTVPYGPSDESGGGGSGSGSGTGGGTAPGSDTPQIVLGYPSNPGTNSATGGGPINPLTTSGNGSGNGNGNGGGSTQPLSVSIPGANGSTVTVTGGTLTPTGGVLSSVSGSTTTVATPGQPTATISPTGVLSLSQSTPGTITAGIPSSAYAPSQVATPPPIVVKTPAPTKTVGFNNSTEHALTQ